jgi:hypothetical protein
VPALPGTSNDETRYRLILAWIEAKHNGYCNHINRGKWGKVEAQIRRCVKWRRPCEAVQVRTTLPAHRTFNREAYRAVQSNGTDLEPGGPEEGQ